MCGEHVEGRIFLEKASGISSGECYFFEKLWLEITFEKFYNFWVLMSAASGQSVCKLTS